MDCKQRTFKQQFNLQYYYVAFESPFNEFMHSVNCKNLSKDFLQVRRGKVNMYLPQIDKSTKGKRKYQFYKAFVLLAILI